MKRCIFLKVGILVMVSVLVSCVTNKKLTYLQYSDKLDNSETSGSDLKTAVTPSSYKLLAYDNLYIRVITPDPQWAEMFNTVPVGQGGALTEESASLIGYPVDANGNIELPFAGKLKVAGKTLSEIKVQLDSTFRHYITDASVSVRLVNNYISILGEVRLPGRYPITKDRLNVFEALSMAGDMSSYGNRQKVQLIRPSPYGPMVKEFSLNDRSILTSDFYYVLPNDVLYAQPIKGRFFGMETFPYAMILSSITSFILIFNFVENLDQ